MYRTCLTTQSTSVRLCLVMLLNVACLLSGCVSTGKSKEIAEHAVDEFHSRLDSERYSEIYAQADEDFKKSSSQEELEKLARAVHQKLGKVQAANQVGYLMTLSSSGMFVTLTYDMTFLDGKATEQFVWRVTDDRAALYNYNVNSADLVTR